MQQVEGGGALHTLVPLRLQSCCHCIGKIVKFDNVLEDITEEIAITWTFGAVLNAGSVVNGDASIGTGIGTSTGTGIGTRTRICTGRRNQG